MEFREGRLLGCGGEGLGAQEVHEEGEAQVAVRPHVGIWPQPVGAGEALAQRLGPALPQVHPWELSCAGLDRLELWLWYLGQVTVLTQFSSVWSADNVTCLGSS